MLCVERLGPRRHVCVKCVSPLGPRAGLRAQRVRSGRTPVRDTASYLVEGDGGKINYRASEGEEGV